MSEQILKPEARKRACLILAACLFLYIAMIAQKNLFAAEIVGIVESFRISKATAGLATTFYFITYGIAQLALAKFFTRINLPRYILVTGLISVLLNIAVPFCTDIRIIWVLFAINGVVQAVIWPGIMLVVSRCIPVEMIDLSNKLLSLGYICGFLLDYLIASVALRFATWRLGFWITTVLLLAAVPFFFFVTSREKSGFTDERKKVSAEKRRFSLKSKLLFFTVVFTGCFVFAFGYGAVLSWVPSLFHDVFATSPSTATLFTTLIPAVVVVGPILIINLNRRFFHWKVSAVTAVIEIVLTVMLALFCRVSLPLSLLLLLLLLICFRGSSNAFDTSVVLRSTALINAGGFSALTNTFNSIGSGLGPTAAGAVIERFGYGASYLMVGLMITVTLIILLFSYRSIKSITSEGK